MFPNFNAVHAYSNSSSRVSDLFSATPSHHRNADPEFTYLPPLHPIFTTYKVPCYLATVHAVSSLTTKCKSPRRDDAIETALSQMSVALDSLAAIPAALASLCLALRRSDITQGTIQLPNDSASRDAVFQPGPIPIQTSLLMLAVPVDNAVANAADQRLAQPLPSATTGASNQPPPPPSARFVWDLDECDLLLKSANRPRCTESSGVCI